MNDGKRRIIVFYKSTATRIRQWNSELCFIGEIWNPFDEFQFDSARIQRSIFHFKCVVPCVLLHDSSNIDFSIIRYNRQSSRGTKYTVSPTLRISLDSTSNILPALD